MTADASRLPAPRGRGAGANPTGRFEAVRHQPDAAATADDPGPRTELLPDATRSILVRNDSPDVGFSWGINPYRGCEHGCVYCYARPSHEYLGMSAGLDFETRILVKHEAPRLLREALADRRWEPAPIALSGNVDAYQPVERRLRITRGCLEVLAEARNPVAVITKSRLVLRDLDLLAALARHRAAAVAITVTTLDDELAGTLEPRATRPGGRLDAIRALAAAGVPVRVMVAPVIPGLTDHEIPRILEAAAEAGATSASWILLRLPRGVSDLFVDWLERHHPDRKGKVLSRLRALRGGRLNDSRFGHRMRGAGAFRAPIEHLFAAGLRRTGLATRLAPLATDAFRRPRVGQLGLFDAS